MLFHWGCFALKSPPMIVFGGTLCCYLVQVLWCEFCLWRCIYCSYGDFRWGFGADGDCFVVMSLQTGWVTFSTGSVWRVAMRTPPRRCVPFGLDLSLLSMRYPGRWNLSVGANHVSVTIAMSTSCSYRNLCSSVFLLFTLVAFHNSVTSWFLVPSVYFLYYSDCCLDLVVRVSTIAIIFMH